MPEAPFNPEYNSISHRDVLGAVYSLGIDESQFGDLWVEDDAIYLYCDKNMASFIMNNLTQIKRARVQLSELDHLPRQIFRFREFQITVSSMRLDTVLSSIIRKSREKARKMIHGSLVSVNYQTIEDCDHLCNNSDILSVRGVGRFMIGETVTKTRSGNMIIKARQFV